MKTPLIPIITVTVSLIFTGLNMAHEGHDHGSDISDDTEQPDVVEEPEVDAKNVQGAGAGTSTRAYKDHDGKTVEVEAPYDITQLWKKIYEQSGELTNIIEAKNVGGVHDATERLNVFLRKLPEVSTMLKPDALRKIRGQIKATTEVVDKIHHVGDAGGFQDAAAQLPTLDKMITLISKQYPEEIITQAQQQAVAGADARTDAEPAE